MPWGSYLHTGTAEVKGRRENVSGWRDAPAGRVTPAIDRAGTTHLRTHLRDLTIVNSRPTQPPPCHTESPS
ncbi:MAG TPA: hypothetical protein VNV87_04490 [Acidimicrobiales bacterium]|jgi:hypothetical protein|nr:hypothetical protein [Acidimicrobiales bacterium]